MSLCIRTCAILVATLSIVAAADAAKTAAPKPLRGIPLRGETGLRLLVAANPPFVLDVDSGRAAPVSGIAARDQGVLSVRAVGGRAAVIVAQPAWPRAELYGVRGRSAKVTSLGTGKAVMPAKDGQAVWIKSASGRSRCTLRKVGLDAAVDRAPRAFPCAWTVGRETSAGLVVRRTLVIDPLTGSIVLRPRWGILAAARDNLVLFGPGRQFTLTDSTGRTLRSLPWPSILGSIDEPAIDPRGRFIALAFADPAWEGGQVSDVWVLETTTRKLSHLPGMPAFVSLKRTSMEWTDDGRLVLLGEADGKDIVAVWRPGQRRLALKTVELPERDSGSDSFAPLR